MYDFNNEKHQSLKEQVFRYQDWYMELPDPLPVVMNYLFMTTLKKNAQYELGKHELSFEDYIFYANDHPQKALILEYATMNELISERKCYLNSTLKKLEITTKIGPHTFILAFDHPFTKENPLL